MQMLCQKTTKGAGISQTAILYVHGAEVFAKTRISLCVIYHLSVCMYTIPRVSQLCKCFCLLVPLMICLIFLQVVLMLC